ncbi:MAG: prenyltransferase [Chloracidobacterium sp.]|nr:prenyltransferase [Chloracidobacterium sp.]
MSVEMELAAAPPDFGETQRNIQQMSDLRFLLNVSRPRFWFYIFGPYIVGLIAGADFPQQLYSPIFLLYGIYFTLPANLLIYGVNDIYDYETDKLNEKKAGYETLVSPDLRPKLWLAIFLTNFAFIDIFFHGNFSVIVSGICFLFFSVFYSAPPIRAKTKPFLDSAFNVLYVLPGAFGYSLITGEFPPAAIIVAAGLWTAAMHAYSAIPDIEADKDAGLKTIATVLGPLGTLAACSLLYLGAAIISFEWLGFTSISIGSAYLILMAASVVSVRSGTLFKLYKAFPLINILAGFIIFWQIALNKFF